MNLFPPPGPDRRRLLLLVGALGIAAALLYWRLSEPPLVIPTTTGPPPTSNMLARQVGGTTRSAATVPQTPQPLKLTELEQVPAEPRAGRNLFRFGVPPAPPPPPPIPIRLVSVFQDPYEPGRLRAYLRDPDSGAIFEQLEGDIVDGRYRLVKVNPTSVVISYRDGTGQRTLMVGGG